ncbi:hypothetical protein RJ639_025758, partial [Escallonia herrerae]
MAVRNLISPPNFFPSFLFFLIPFTHFVQESAGMTLMDLITSDPTPTSALPPPSPTSSQSAAAGAALTSPSPPYATTSAASSKANYESIMQNLISLSHEIYAAFNGICSTSVQPVSYAQLARSIHELAATSDQKSSQKQLVHHVFPKLAVYNSVDPSLAPSLLM